MQMPTFGWPIFLYYSLLHETTTEREWMLLYDGHVAKVLTSSRKSPAPTCAAFLRASPEPLALLNSVLSMCVCEVEVYRDAVEAKQGNWATSKAPI